MPLGVGFAFQSTDNMVLVDEAWSSLIGGPTQLLGLTVGPIATLVELKGYVLNLSEDDAKIRIVIDGTEVAQGSPENPLMYVAAFPTTVVGVHTIDFQAKALDGVEQAFAGPVGFTAIDFLTV